MSNQPEQPDDLERMFASEEASIRDDGFTARVMDQARHSNGLGLRRTIVYGAGMAGFGAAVAGIIEMAPHLPKMSGWWPGVSAALKAAPETTVDSPLVMMTVAVIAVVGFFCVAVLAQER